MAYNFVEPMSRETSYWRDVGSLDAYYEIESIDGLEPEIKQEWGG